VVNCIVRHDDKILLVRRSGLVAHHGNRWGCVTGFIDRLMSLEALVGSELREELSVDVASASTFRCARPFRFADDAVAKVWIVYPVLVSFEQRPRIRLNWENGAFRWIQPAETDNFRVIPGQARALAVAIGTHL
jgi:ADP-ribose pyrophosphatase YjhB (NUDIX family)